MMPEKGYMIFENKNLKATFNRDNYQVDDTSENNPEYTPDYKGRDHVTIPALSEEDS